MTKVQVPALARLLPKPGTIPLSTSEKMPKMGMSQISPSRKFRSPRPFQLCISAVFAFVITSAPLSLPSIWLVFRNKSAASGCKRASVAVTAN